MILAVSRDLSSTVIFPSTTSVSTGSASPIATLTLPVTSLSSTSNTNVVSLSSTVRTFWISSSPGAGGVTNTSCVVFLLLSIVTSASLGICLSSPYFSMRYSSVTSVPSSSLVLILASNVSVTVLSLRDLASAIVAVIF